MQRNLACLLVMSLIVPSAQAQTTAQQASTTSVPSPQSVDSVVKSVREDLQSSKADIMAKNMELTADQAAKFWPVYNTYQKAQNSIIEEQLKGIQKYVDGYDTLDDATALSLMKAHLQRDAKINDLRLKYLGEFQKVLPAKLAVRAMQIDRRLSLAGQVEIASHIPLAH